MSLNGTPTGESVHISFFGKRNAGKSSIINAVTGQNLSIVSDVKGTTTDPVLKSMELLPIGPVVVIDTPGLDDEGELGRLRVEKSYQMLNKTDIAVVVIDSYEGITKQDNKLIDEIKAKNIPYVIAYNKCDIKSIDLKSDNEICVSAMIHKNINELKELIAKQIKPDSGKRIIGDLLSKDDIVILVVPIDSAAPKGRIILPQQQTLRDVLDSNAVCITVQDTELENTLKLLSKPPRVIITDSQVFEKVAKIVPKNIYLTSFSILMLRYKGELELAIKNVKTIDLLENGDTVLISEGCTHHRQCDDIGTVKMPKWLQNYTGKKLNFEYSSGTGFPKDLSKYKLIVHCGGCMLNETEMKYRANYAQRNNIPITNYGIAIAHMNGILDRCIAILK